EERLSEEEELMKKIREEMERRKVKEEGPPPKEEAVSEIEGVMPKEETSLMREIPEEKKEKIPGEEELREKEMEIIEAVGKEKDQDDLLKLMQKSKKISVKNAAKVLKVSEDTINKWANELKEKGILDIRPKFLGGANLELTRDALKRLKELEEEEKIARIKSELERIREEQKRIRGTY
ncbi:MAG: hypothetical protein B6U86_06185, partial [Candidatus Altiarchaeales archaeon ex4484_43]